MSFETFFRAASYTTVACGAAALGVAGGLGWGLALAFAAVLVAGWWLEAMQRQLSERAGLIVILISLPLFYLDWRMQASLAPANEEVNAGVAALVHFTLFLSAVKLIQVKTDRDWVFLYLISFFVVLLGAGMSVSPFFIAALILYLFFALLTIVSFELRRAQKKFSQNDYRLHITFEGSLAGRRKFGRVTGREASGIRRLPFVAMLLLLLVFTFALPIFYMMPRFGNRSVSLAAGAETAQVGFSDTVSLGDFGRIQRNNQLVMRVRVEGERAARGNSLRWRGIPLDYFDGRTWKRSSNENVLMMGGERDFFQLGTTQELGRLTTQTFFIEPIDTPILFAAPRVVALQGALDFVKTYKDGGALATRPHPKERINYRVYSDTVEPSPEVLRADNRRYPSERTLNLQVPIENYLRYPAGIDSRVNVLARRILNDAVALNRYDAARAIEAHLGQNAYRGSYTYSLERRGEGNDPLADFLFNVREGHCEYFATAMVVMLRTQGIAARIVNGFQAGEYNASADAYIVRQYDAHSWVEVYFPETDSWLTFDPTPADGRPRAAERAGFAAQMREYAEALDLFWIQYVVAYDKDEQRSLANSIRVRFDSVRRNLAQATEGVSTVLSSLWSAKTARASSTAFYAQVFLAVLAVSVLLFVAVRGGRKLFSIKRADKTDASNTSAIEFYTRLTTALERRGFRREADQTPLEFAESIDLPEVLTITRAYHRVRYGGRVLSAADARDIERCLQSIENQETFKTVETAVLK